MAAGSGLEPMCPSSSIALKGAARMPGDNDGGSRSSRLIQTTEPISMLLRSDGVGRIRVIGGSIDLRTRSIVGRIVSCRRAATGSGN